MSSENTLGAPRPDDDPEQREAVAAPASQDPFAGLPADARLVVRTRRAPRIGRIIIIAAVLGAVVGLLTGLLTASDELGSVIYFTAIGILVIGGLGTALAVVLDSVSRRGERTVRRGDIGTIGSDEPGGPGPH